MPGSLKRELKQKRPFSSVQEEVVLSLIRTTDLLVAPLNEVLRESGLSLSQYNILRILRGAGDEGLPCGEITGRMVRRDPDLTRLLDRMETRELVARTRGTADRRVVRATITDRGLALLDSLEETIARVLKESLRHMPLARVKALCELLAEARAGNT